MEKLRSLQEQALGTLETRTDAMMEWGTQAIMVMLDVLLGDRSGSRNRGANSGLPNREPRVNFNEHSNRRRTYGSTTRRGISSSYVTGDNRLRGPANIGGGSTGNRPTSEELLTRDANATGRCDSTSWSRANQGRIQPKDSYRRVIL